MVPGEAHWPSDDLQRGDVLREEGRLLEAEAAYREVLEGVPPHAEARYKLFDLYLEMGRLEEAIQELYCLSRQEVNRHLEALAPAGTSKEEVDNERASPPAVAQTYAEEPNTSSEPPESQTSLESTPPEPEVGARPTEVLPGPSGSLPGPPIREEPRTASGTPAVQSRLVEARTEDIWQTRTESPPLGRTPKSGKSRREAVGYRRETTWWPWLARAAGGVLLAALVYVIWGVFSDVPQRKERSVGQAPVATGVGQMARPGALSQPAVSAPSGPAAPQIPTAFPPAPQIPSEDTRRVAVQERQSLEEQRPGEEPQRPAGAQHQGEAAKQDETPVPAPTPLAAFMAQLTPGPYGVIVASAATAEGAQREVAAIQAKYPELRPWTSQSLDGRWWTVGIGESYSQPAAEALRKKAIELGLRRDAFIWDTRRAR
jgi:hypothetical protein